MFPAVVTEEIAFAMTLFMGAANGQAPPVPQSAGNMAQQQRVNRLRGQQFFLELSLGMQELMDQARCDAALNSSLCRAMLAVWDQYEGDPQQASICARVLGFCYLMEETRGELVQGLTTAEAEPDEVTLHPAVIETVAKSPLTQSGTLTRQEFASTLKEVLAQRTDAPAAHVVTAISAEPAVSPGQSSWPVGDGEMAGLIRARDWGPHELGVSSAWPQSLRTAVDLMLACKFPMIVLWGGNLLQLYNDAYRDVMGRKHPAGLGQSTRQCWPEVWDFNAPVYEQVLAGKSLTFENQLFPINRYGYLEDAYFTLCYSPLREEQGGVNGVLVTVFETTSNARLWAARKAGGRSGSAGGGLGMGQAAGVGSHAAR